VRPDTKRCPECGEDFVHTAETCSDCGVPLRLASELVSGTSPAPVAGADMALLRAEGPAWIEALADALAAEGIASRVAILDPEQHGVRSGVRGAACGLFVAESDHARARRVDAAVERQQIPDLRDHEAADAEDGDEACPACGHALAADAAECPDCGLGFG